MIAFDCRLERGDFTFDAAFEVGGGVTALFGPSGSGKSTIIKLMAGLERPNRGRIAFGDKVVLDTQARIFVPPHRRRIGLVFQDALLFPHLSVRGNLVYGRWFTPRAERRVGFDPVVEVLGIGHLLDRRPETLSGGERQRVAIGRALIASPRLLLMDEPLASLDGDRKLEILPFIERLRDEFDIPIVYVSHSVEEVVRLAARVVRLDDGKVTTIGAPAEVLPSATLARGGDRFDAISVLTARVKERLPDYGVTVLDHPAGEIVVPGLVADAGRPVQVTIRATNVTLGLGSVGNVSIRTILSGRIARLERGGGPFALATVALPGGDVVRAYATRLAADRLGLNEGDEVQVMVKAATIDERGVASLPPVPQSGSRTAPV